MKFELEEFYINISEADLISDIKCVADLLHKTSISTSEYKQYGKYGVTTIIRRFKSWNNCLQKAGLEVGRNINISNNDLFKNIEEIWIKLGRQPRSDEMKKPLSKYSIMPYRERFGTWNNALKAFISFINSESEEDNDIKKTDENSIQEPEGKKILNKKRTKREISERLRFRILMRDGFACKKCGRSPMIEIGVELHVDHIIPWSKGGETIPENLETKCKDCNLGKGNAFNV